MAAKRTNELDFMQSWLDADNFIQFVSSLLTRTQLPNEAREQINAHIAQIQRRRNDPNLYIAVVGEFNSGKSTFINALLRQNLLKQSTVVRTAVPTKIIYGDTADIKVLFTGESQLLSYVYNYKKFLRRLRALKPSIALPEPDQKNAFQRVFTPNSRKTLPEIDVFRDYLHMVTTDIQVAPFVQEVIVYQPAAFLKQNIIIIDTPGTNSRDPQHIEITRRVIGQDADAIVVTIPATAALSGKLADFMESDLKPFLHRCLSVVTRLDQLDSNEQHMVLDDLHERLVEIIGMRKISLYEAAPQIVIDSLDPEKIVPPHLRQWQTRFAELETIIWQRLRYERTLNVSESLLRLMTQLLTLLEKHLSERENSYRRRQQAIQNEIIPDLIKFSNDEIENITRVSSYATSDALRKTQEKVRRRRSNTSSAIETYLNEASSGSEFEAVTEVHASQLLTDARNELIRDFAPTMNAVSQQISQAMSQSEARFTAAYRRLESAGQISLSSNTSTYIPPFSVSVQDVLSNSSQVTTNINGQEIALKGGGFLGGAALGTVLIPIPVFGTLIGGLIGGIVGALFTSTERKREKIREALVPEIDNFFAQLSDALENSINVYSSQVSTNVTRQIQAHVAKYKLIVQKVQEQRVIEQQSLQQFQQIIQNDLKEIKWRQSILQQKQQQLKENNSFR